MSWNTYRLTYRLLSPLHIGYRRFGTVQRTRYYVPGRTLWGAISARLTRARYARPGPDDYVAVATYVRDHLVAGYFFPALGEEEPLWPKFEQGRWRYGSLPASDFEARLISSLGSTALAGPTWTAEEGTLHETEFIAAQEQTGRPWGRPVSLQGYLYLDQDRSAAPAPLRDLSDLALIRLLERLTVGGELRYGFGHILLDRTPGNPVVCAEQWPNPRDFDETSRTLRAHLRVSPDTAGMVRGTAEPLVGREWAGGQRGGTRRGAGQDISRAIVGWTPGGLFEGDPACLRVGRYGVWECVAEPAAARALDHSARGMPSAGAAGGE